MIECSKNGRENYPIEAFEGVKMLGLKCNLGLALIGLQTTGLWSPFETPYVSTRS